MFWELVSCSSTDCVLYKKNLLRDEEDVHRVFELEDCLVVLQRLENAALKVVVRSKKKVERVAVYMWKQADAKSVRLHKY